MLTGSYPGFVALLPKRYRLEPSCATRECAVVVAQLAAADICELAQALQRNRRADALDVCERPIRIAARLVVSHL
jgi:hypothetical protein